MFVQPRAFLNGAVRAMAIGSCLGHYSNSTLKKPWAPGVSRGLLVLWGLGAWWTAVQLRELLVLEQQRGRLDVHRGLRVG